MRFSDSFLRSLKDRASIADYAGRLVQWDRRRSQPAKGDYWAPCPFHSEKSASFHVRDPQGAFKCFGCGEAGGVLDLAMKLEGLSFPEAVERVAAFAGLALPEPERGFDEAGERRRARLLAAAAAAQTFFRAAIEAPQGRAAKAYAEKRGLDAATRAAFGIGYAPDGWTAGLEALTAQGFTPEELIEAGLASAGDQRRPIDVFRDRLTFPIADAQGRIIAFGGRALNPAAKAKYLNSPETPLFHKGATLYRLKEARALAARTKAPGLVVAEGYLDVIALERAGIAAVAPLGTALTPEQLQLIWRAGAEPICCFDGDAAGRRAAERALDLALPQVGPQRTLRVAFLPQGQDPDDVFRSEGPAALAALLGAAKPAVEALFERERDRESLDTPERKSGFKKRLREAAQRIEDGETAALYRAELFARADALITAAQARPGPARAPAPGRRGPGERGEWRGRAGANGAFARPPALATAELKPLAAPGQRQDAKEGLIREAIDLPQLLERWSESFSALPLADPDLIVLRDEALNLFSAQQTIDRSALSRHLTHLGEERAAARVLRWPQPHPGRDLGAVEAEWIDLVQRDVAEPARKQEMAALRASGDLDSDPDAFARAWKVGSDALHVERERRAREDESSKDGASADGDAS